MFVYLFCPPYLYPFFAFLCICSFLFLSMYSFGENSLLSGCLDKVIFMEKVGLHGSYQQKTELFLLT